MALEDDTFDVVDRVVTANLPLTTVFTPPPYCRGIPFTFSTAHSGISTFWRDADGAGQGRRSACYPKRCSLQYNPTIHAQYSPGVCPSGYSGAQTQAAASGHAVTSICCPLNMTYSNQFGCVSTVTTPTVVDIGYTPVTLATDFIAADWPITVAWASSDLNRFTPRSAPILPLAVQTAGNISNATWTNLPPAHPPPAVIPPDAAAGVGVGILVFVSVFAVAVFALWRRKRKRGLVRPEGESEMQGRDGSQKAFAHYAESQCQPEMTQTEQPPWGPRESEEVSPSIRAALEGSWQDYQAPSRTGTESR